MDSLAGCNASPRDVTNTTSSSGSISVDSWQLVVPGGASDAQPEVVPGPNPPANLPPNPPRRRRAPVLISLPSSSDHLVLAVPEVRSGGGSTSDEVDLATRSTGTRISAEEERSQRRDISRVTSRHETPSGQARGRRSRVPASTTTTARTTSAQPSTAITWQPLPVDQLRDGNLPASGGRLAGNLPPLTTASPPPVVCTGFPNALGPDTAGHDVDTRSCRGSSLKSLRKRSLAAGVLSGSLTLLAILKVTVHSVSLRNQSKLFSLVLDKYNSGQLYSENNTDHTFDQYRAVLDNGQGRKMLQLINYSCSLHSAHIVMLMLVLMTAWQVIRSSLGETNIRTRDYRRDRISTQIIENQQYSRYHLAAWLFTQTPLLLSTIGIQSFEIFRCKHSTIFQTCYLTSMEYMALSLWTVFIFVQLLCYKPIYATYKYLVEITENETQSSSITAIYNITNDDINRDLRPVHINLTPPAYNDAYDDGYKWTYSGADLPTDAPPRYTARDLTSVHGNC